MAKLHHTGKNHDLGNDDPEHLLAFIQEFLRRCKRPAVLEFGDELILLESNTYSLELSAGRLWINVWQGNRNISRRILSIERTGTGAVDCAIHRFGGKPGRLSFLDVDKPQTAHRTVSGSRQNFMEQFRRMLCRQFPGWELVSLSSAMDLQRSFSPVFPRAKLIRGRRVIAAMACPTAEDEANLLSFAILWFAYLQGRSNPIEHMELCLFLPEDAGCLTAHRCSWLDHSRVSVRMFRFNEHGSAGEVDPQDLGNLDTRVTPHYISPKLRPEIEELLATVSSLEGVSVCPELSGGISIRHRGVEFARVENEQLFLGMQEKRVLAPASWTDVQAFALELGTLSSSANGPGPATSASSRTVDRAGERWLEAKIRQDIALVEPCIREHPVHGQVLTFAGEDRDLVDLLGVTVAGRLLVLELKIAEDLHLPIQALDYWMRVSWHAKRCELGHLFPGVAILDSPPQLRLIAPALAFHSTNAIVLRYFSPEIDVERVGVNSDWSSNLRVVLRLRGAEAPQSHGGSHERPRATRNQKGTD